MSEPVMHYFVENIVQVKQIDYAGLFSKPMTKTICGRLLHGHNARTATKDKNKVSCNKCLTHKFE